MHIGLFGLSGSGKTTLATRLICAHPNYSAISASRLIADQGGVIDYDLLDNNNIGSNQSILVLAYERYKAKHPNTIVELHCLIETETGVDLVDIESLKALNLDAVFFLYLPEEEIIKRRTLDTRKRRRNVTLSELKSLQDLSVKILENTFANITNLTIPETAFNVISAYINDMTVKKT